MVFVSDSLFESERPGCPQSIWAAQVAGLPGRVAVISACRHCGLGQPGQPGRAGSGWVSVPAGPSKLEARAVREPG